MEDRHFRYKRALHYKSQYKRPTNVSSWDLGNLTKNTLSTYFSPHCILVKWFLSNIFFFSSLKLWSIIPPFHRQHSSSKAETWIGGNQWRHIVFVDVNSNLDFSQLLDFCRFFISSLSPSLFYFVYSSWILISPISAHSTRERERMCVRVCVLEIEREREFAGCKVVLSLPMFLVRVTCYALHHIQKNGLLIAAETF